MRYEELQLELSAAMKAKPTTSSVRHPTSQHSSLGERENSDENVEQMTEII